MLISVPSVRWNCPSFVVPGVRVKCFRPNPFNTRGEARYAASQAHLHRWHSLIVVSSVPQSTRARLRVERCFHGTVQVVVATPTASFGPTRSPTNGAPWPRRWCGKGRADMAKVTATGNSAQGKGKSAGVASAKRAASPSSDVREAAREPSST